MKSTILAVNAGSSSIKFALYATDSSSRDFYPDINYDGTRIAWSKVAGNDTDIYLADLMKDAGGNYSLSSGYVRNSYGPPEKVEVLQNEVCQPVVPPTNILYAIGLFQHAPYVC